MEHPQSETIEQVVRLAQALGLGLRQDAPLDEGGTHQAAMIVGIGRVRERVGAKHGERVVVEGDIHGRQQVEWLHRIDAAYDNIRVAMTWCLDGGDVAIGGNGDDEIYGDAATPAAGDLGDVLLGDNGDIFLLGTVGKLIALGTAVRLIDTTDVMESTGGADTIFGDQGNDIIFGGNRMLIRL